MLDMVAAEVRRDRASMTIGPSVAGGPTPSLATKGIDVDR
jgi:hypothetical protein